LAIKSGGNHVERAAVVFEGSGQKEPPPVDIKALPSRLLQNQISLPFFNPLSV